MLFGKNCLIFSVFPGFLLGSGCISIGTHEKQMSKLRQAQDNNLKMQEELTLLEAKNAQLERDLTDKKRAEGELKEELTDTRVAYDGLIQELKDSIAEGDVGVKQEGDDIAITVGNKVLFGSGRANLQPKGQIILGKVAGIFKRVTGRRIRVEGHTDSTPISAALKDKFPSNWELSAARSAAVVHFLQKKAGVDPSLLVLTAFAEYEPVGDNKTAEGRALNRRVDIYFERKTN